jgi:uncharacterized protein YdaU (DUF1376 family)
MNYYPFHIGDYISHTRNLSLLEDLAYRRLLDECYLHEQPLVTGIEALARQIGMRDHVTEVKYVLETFFQLTDAGWINARAMQEIEKYKGYAAAGKRGAEKRWAGYSHPNTSPIATNNHKPITNNHKPKKNIDATPFGVAESIWQDFLKLRKAKKAPITETVLKGIQREANKVPMSLENALQTCCERGWMGFKAEWIKQPVDKQLAAARTIFGDERKANDGTIIDIN